MVNLAECLNAMGAKIEGAGTPTIHIQGVSICPAPAIASFQTGSKPAPMPWRLP